MRRLTSIAILALMIVGMALTGCGDDNGGTPGASPTPTSPEVNQGLPTNRM